MIIRVFVLSICCFLIQPVSSQSIKAMTYNIRYSIPSDSRDNWDSRKDKMAQLFNHYKPDVFGIQEGMIHQLEFLDNKLEDHKYLGAGREDGKQKGEFSAIFYNKKKLRLLNQNTFWLSESMETGSKGWNAGYIRICTYALFEERTSQKKFWVFNTHFDHIGAEARLNSGHLVLKEIKRINKDRYPLVLMGDLNDSPGSEVIELLKSELSDASESTIQPLYGPQGTFSGFQPKKEINRRIDYIFVSDFKVLSYSHIDDRLDFKTSISDHLPVSTVLQFKMQK